MAAPFCTTDTFPVSCPATTSRFQCETAFETAIHQSVDDGVVIRVTAERLNMGIEAMDIVVDMHGHQAVAHFHNGFVLIHAVAVAVADIPAATKHGMIVQPCAKFIEISTFEKEIRRAVLSACVFRIDLNARRFRFWKRIWG